jgi:hypothetical protein
MEIILLFWIKGIDTMRLFDISRDKPPHFGYERAYARSYPKCGFLYGKYQRTYTDINLRILDISTRVCGALIPKSDLLYPEERRGRQANIREPE